MSEAFTTLRNLLAPQKTKGTPLNTISTRNPKPLEFAESFRFGTRNQKEGEFVLVESHSKCIEVQHMKTKTATRTIDKPRLILATHGLPEEVVSDNGPQFTSSEFAAIMRRNGIKHTLIPPYHPQSNRAAERSVRVVKEALVKQVIQGTKGVSMKH